MSSRPARSGRRARTGLLVTVLTAVLALLAAGCGGGTGAGGGSKSFTYWSMWKVGEPQQKVIAQAITDFTAQTGIKVNAQWQGRNNFQKLTPALNTNAVPDLVDGPYLKAYPAMVATDQALGLQAAYDATVDGQQVSELIPAKYLSSIDLKLADGQPWMVPYQIQSDAVWFDAAKHPEIAKNPPATWSELMSTMSALKAKGEAPLAADGDIPGYNAAWLSTLIVREGGPGALKKVAQDRTGQAWKQPEVLDAAGKVEKLVRGGYLLDGYAASKFPAQQQLWADDKAALMFNGSWLPTESSTYAAQGFDYGSFPFPKTGTHDSARVDFSGFLVPKKAQHADAAQQFAAFLLSKTYQDAWGQEAKGIPVRPDAAVAPELAGVQEAITSAGGYHQQNDGVAFPGYNEKVFWPNDDQLFLGKLTAAQFVDKMATDQAAYWKTQG